MKLNYVSPVGHQPSLETDAHFENVVRKTTVTTCYVVPISLLSEAEIRLRLSSAKLADWNWTELGNMVLAA